MLSMYFKMINKGYIMETEVCNYLVYVVIVAYSFLMAGSLLFIKVKG